MVHAKPMTSQSMHHKLPGSEILLRFKSKTCSVATTKQTVAVGIAVVDQNAHFNIAVYIYIVYMCSYHFTVSDRGRPQQLTATLYDAEKPRLSAKRPSARTWTTHANWQHSGKPMAICKDNCPIGIHRSQQHSRDDPASPISFTLRSSFLRSRGDV